MTKNKDIFYVSQHLAKTLSFPDFLDKETGARIKWSKNGASGLGNCPMPDHKDTNASFHVNQMEDGMWVYHCFGCNRSGTIISFCKEYFSLSTKTEAILMLCQKYNVENPDELILEGIKNISKKVDLQRIAENENIRISNLCRMALKKDFEQNKQTIMKAYKTINKHMDNNNIENEDVDSISKIGEDISKLLFSKQNGTK